MRRSRGTTLAELMVALGVMAFLSLVLVILSKVGFRVSSEEISRSGAETRLLTVTRRLENDLLNTSPAGVSLDSGERKLVIHPIEQLANRGRIVYLDKFQAWLWSESDKCLRRCELTDSPTGTPFDSSPIRWTLAQLSTLPESGSGLLTLKLDDVILFKVSNPEEVELPAIGSPLSFEVKMELPEAATRKEFSIQRTIRLRTSGSI